MALGAQLGLVRAAGIETCDLRPATARVSKCRLEGAINLVVVPPSSTERDRALPQRRRVDAPGNPGFVLYVDILLPIIGFVLVWLSRRHPVPVAAPMGQRGTQTAEG